MICQVDDLQAEYQRSLSGDFNVSYTAGRLLNVFDAKRSNGCQGINKINLIDCLDE